MERKVRVASGFARPPRRRLHPHGDFFRLARTRDFCHPLEAGHHLAMALDRWCSRATSCRNSTSGKMLPPGRSDRTLPTYSHRAPGSKRPPACDHAYGSPVDSVWGSPALTPHISTTPWSARATTGATLSVNRSTPPLSLRAPVLGRTVRSPPG